MVTLAVVVFPAKSVAWYVRVYTRPGPTPERSARRRTRVSSVPTSALWMSFVVSPSPTPLSGSLLVADTRTTRTAPRLSLAATERTTSTIRWSGGQRIRGLAVTERTGGVLSTTHARVAGLESALPAAAMAEATRSCHQPKSWPLTPLATRRTAYGSLSSLWLCFFVSRDCLEGGTGCTGGGPLRGRLTPSEAAFPRSTVIVRLTVA